MPDLVRVEHDPFEGADPWGGGDAVNGSEYTPPSVNEVEYTPQGIPRITVTPAAAPQGSPQGEPMDIGYVGEQPAPAPAVRSTQPLAWRDRFRWELSNPETRDRLAAYTQAEVGGQGQQAQQAFMEETLNRARARGQSIPEVLSGSYFPWITHARARSPLTDQQRGYYAPLIESVLGGSNITNFATGNASGSVGFAGGPQTAKYGGERFGREGPDLRWVRAAEAAERGAPVQPENPPVQPSQTLMGGLRAFMPNVASIASGQPAPPMENFPAQPGKVPEVYDPRYERAAGEVAEQGVNLVGPPMKAAAGAAAAGAAKFAPAIFAGAAARTAPKAALREAERMLGAGVEEAGVTRATGISRGATDPGLRWEINDQPAKIKTTTGWAVDPRTKMWTDKPVASALDDTGNWKHGTVLPDILDHPELYKAYPELARARVKQPMSIDNRGAYHPDTGEFELDPRLPPEEQIKTILHEVQHHAQTREGFAAGSYSGDPATKAISDQLLQQQSIDPYHEYRTRRAAEHVTYRHVAGEVEARNVATRRGMSPEERRTQGPRTTEQYPPEHQIFRAPRGQPMLDQGIEDFAKALIESHPTGGAVEQGRRGAGEGAQAAAGGGGGGEHGVAKTPREGTLARWAGISHDPGTSPDVAEAYERATQTAGGHEPLIGLPDAPMNVGGETYVPGPIGYIHDAAEKYMRDAGLKYEPTHTYAAVDKARAKRIAEEYDAMEHAPNDPAVKASYEAMAKETVAQFRAIEDAGIKFEFIKPGMEDPYAESPRLGQMDVEQNKHLWVFPSSSGFGTENLISDNPLLKPSGVFIEGRELPYNDVFRIVHDIYGHHKEGNGFRAAGEENAWRSHSAMYSDLARPAMTSETRGQNSWVNYGPHGDTNRTASAADTVFADQKTGIMPPWVMEQGRRDPPGAGTGAGAGVEPAPRQITPFPSGPPSARFVNLMDKVSGLKGIAPYLTPEEQELVGKPAAKTLVDIFEKLPSPEEMAAVAYSGRAKRGWYRNSAEALVNIFGASDAPRFAALLAALSPQVSVEVNATNALNTWKNWVAAGRPTDVATIKGILGESVSAGAAGGGEASVLGAWVPNVLRALKVQDTTKLSLSGPKVSSFMLNLRDNVHEVTNDAWIANYANIDQDLLGGAKRAQPSEFSKTFREKSGGYLAMSARVRKAAEVLSQKTGQPWTPAEIQETVWSWARTLTRKVYGDSTVERLASIEKDATIKDLLEAGDITHEEIANTPDFAQLFVSGMYRRILEEAGLGKGIQRAAKSLAQRGTAGRGAAHGDSPTSAEGSGFAEPAFRAHLGEAAKRLDIRIRQAGAGE
jgi:hypothetical protein